MAGPGGNRPGKLWESEITNAVEQSVFFIPIVTPRAVNSDYCKFEFESFLTRERMLGRADLMFPILYVPVPALQDEARWRSHPVLSVIAKRQYVDWQTFRYADVHTPTMREEIARFAFKIAEALNQPWVSPEEIKRRKDAETQKRADEERLWQECEAKQRAETQRIADERRRQEVEAKRRADEEEQRRQAEAEARQRAEEERRSSEAEARQRADEERAFATAKTANSFGAKQDDPQEAAEARRKAAEEHEATPKTENEKKRERQSAQPSTTVLWCIFVGFAIIPWVLAALMR